MKNNNSDISSGGGITTSNLNMKNNSQKKIMDSTSHFYQKLDFNKSESIKRFAAIANSKSNFNSPV